MALKAISNSEYGILLWKLSNLPYDDEEGKRLEQQLREAKQRYEELLMQLSVAIENFNETAARIKVKTHKKNAGLGYARSAAEVIDL